MTDTVKSIPKRSYSSNESNKPQYTGAAALFLYMHQYKRTIKKPSAAEGFLILEVLSVLVLDYCAVDQSCNKCTCERSNDEYPELEQ